MTTIFGKAAELWSEMQTEYQAYVDASYDKALEACNGVLVNKAARALHIDGYSLFQGTQQRAYRYASPELIEYWAKTSRHTIASFEQEWMQGRPEFQYN